MSRFTQSAPQLGNQYDDDRVLRSLLARRLPEAVMRQVEGDLSSMGALAGGALYALQLADRDHLPTLRRWDAWGNRVDHIELTPLWQQAREVAAKSGLVAAAYEGTHQPYGRLVQFALVYLFHASSDVYTCPLAMTDGAARALLASGNQDLIHRAVGHLTSRDPARSWTAGQWMTETTGGSDVSGTETIARQVDGQWRLFGRKWFTSAATSEMALTLARPEGNPAGASGLALFYVETRDADGRLRNIRIERLKDKLGTRKLPTAELELDGTPATPVTELANGVRHIAPVLNITRVWNAVCAVSFMRRGLALARDYANRRVAFGQPLADQPLHQVTLAHLQAEFEAAFHLVFHVIELLGLAENDRLETGDQDRLRLLIPITKLLTGKQVVAVTSEIIECLGGAGYVEDTGLPTLLRDAQVLPIWEGTTNVLSLDVLGCLGKGQGLERMFQFMQERLDAVGQGLLDDAVSLARRRIEALGQWLEAFVARGDEERQAAARSLCLALGRLYSLVLLIDHADHCLNNGRDPRPAAAARLFARSAALWLDPPTLDDARVLATDIYA